jgi:hypothetical protein
MPNEFLVKTGVQISFADHAGDFGPTAANVLEFGTPTNVQLSLASLATGTARQSAKFDFGTTRAPSYASKGAIEFATGVVAGEKVSLYLAFSASATAGTGNAGGVSGADSAYAGTAASTVEESVQQLTYIGTFTATDDITTTVQIAEIASFTTKERYASLVVVNNTTPAFHSDDVEMNIVFNPIIPELQ